jgi:hypothetical protein
MEPDIPHHAPAGFVERREDAIAGRMLSTGIAYYEGEVYNILRHGRTSPPVPLLIIGIVP